MIPVVFRTRAELVDLMTARATVYPGIICNRCEWMSAEAWDDADALRRIAARPDAGRVVARLARRRAEVLEAHPLEVLELERHPYAGSIQSITVYGWETTGRGPRRVRGDGLGSRYPMSDLVDVLEALTRARIPATWDRRHDLDAVAYLRTSPRYW